MASLAEDRDEIRDLFARYCLYIDTGASDDWADLFAEDGELAGVGEPVVGRDALAAFAAAVAAGSGGMHHLVLNEVIDVDGDHAAARSSIVMIAGSSVGLTGRYEDTLRRVDGRWRLARRLLHRDG